MEGLALLTHNCYASSQKRFVEFYLFVTHLAQSVRPATIKVYLSAARALHIEQGFSDPLMDCLRLQRVVRGIKRPVGEAGSTRLPGTDQTLLLIFKALDFSKHDHIMFWVACNLAYFGFLRSAEFTVPNLGSFSPDIHLNVAHMAIDSYDAPTCLCIRLKASKTDPFQKGWLMHVSKGNPMLCAIHSLMANLLASAWQTFLLAHRHWGTFREEERLRLSDRNSILITQNLSGFQSEALIGWRSSFIVLLIVYQWQTKDKRPQRSNVNVMNL